MCLLQLLDPHEIRKRAIQDHIASDQAEEQVEIHDEPACDCGQRSDLVTEENIRVVQKIGYWLSLLVDVDEKS